MTLPLWIHVIYVGCVLVSAQFNPDNGLPSDGELLPGMSFDALMQIVADVFKPDTFKGSIAEACESARQLIEGLFSETTDGVSYDFDVDSFLDSLCSPIEKSLATGEDANVYTEICWLLEVAYINNHQYNDYYYYPKYPGDYNDYYDYGDIIRVDVPEGYRWLFNSFILLTLDSDWASPWRYHIGSPRELIDGAFKMDWRVGGSSNSMDCSTMAQELGDLTAKEFIERAMRNSFHEALRNRYYPAYCEATTDIIDVDDGLLYEIIDRNLRGFFGKYDCLTLGDAFDDFDSGRDRTRIERIVEGAVNTYYGRITDDIKCQLYLEYYVDEYPDFGEAISNYTGYPPPPPYLICEALRDIYGYASNPKQAEHTPPIYQSRKMSQYGFHHAPIDDPTFPYRYYLSLSSTFLNESHTALSALLAVCSALNDLDSENREMCSALTSASVHQSWSAFGNICESDFLQRYDYDAWREKFYANHVFTIIYNSFFLFTFNGDWDELYRHEFISITKLLRQAFDLWPNYNTICQLVDDALDEPARVMIQGAVTNTFKSYIRDHLPALCLILAPPRLQHGRTTTTKLPGYYDETLFYDEDAPSILGGIFQFLLGFDSKEAMCSSLPQTMEGTKTTAEGAAASFLQVLNDETKCQAFLNIHRNVEGFDSAIYKFTGFFTVDHFCRQLVHAFSSQSEKPQLDRSLFESKYLYGPYDAYLSGGDVFEGVNFQDFLPVADKLLNSATLREGVNLLCDIFEGSLDNGRRDNAICAVLNSEQRNFRQECNLFHLLTDDSGTTDRQRNMWPWIMLERWLPDWFHEYTGFDHMYFMFNTEISNQSTNLDLAKVLNRVFDFSDSNPQTTCDRLADLVVNRKEGPTIRHILEGVIGHTVGYISKLAPTLCLADHVIPSPYIRSDEWRAKTTPAPQKWWLFNETHWTHLHIGPVEGPMVGKIFAYLNGYNPIDSMCEILLTSGKVNTESLRIQTLENLRKVYTNSWNCRRFVEFIDAERRKTHLNIQTFAEESGFDSTDAMCQAVVDALSGGSENSVFDWAEVANHYRLYYPEEWHPSEGNILPGVSFHEFTQMLGSIYNTTLQSSLTTACQMLHIIESHADNFPFEYELCLLADDAENDQRFRDYCYGQASQYQTYFENHGPDIYPPYGPYDDDIYYGYPNGDFVNGSYTYYEDQYWGIPPELHAMHDFAKARFGLDIQNPYSICEVTGELMTLSMGRFLEDSTDGVAVVAEIFLKTNYSMICNRRQSSEDANDFPPEFPAYLLTVLADYQSLEEFCNQLSRALSSSADNADTCSFETIDPNLQRIATDIASNALNVIKDKAKCKKIAGFLFQHVSEYLSQMTGFNSEDTLCTMLVDAFTTSPDAAYKPPTVPSDAAEKLESFEPFQVPGQLLPIVNFSEAVEFVGHVYNLPSLHDVLVYLCEHYDHTLYMLPNVSQELKMVCNAVIDEGDIDQFVSTCKSMLVPLRYGSDYPIGLRQVNVSFEIQRVLLNLGGENTIMNRTRLALAIQNLVNSDRSLRDLMNGVLDALLPNLLRTAYAICDDWEAVNDYLAPTRDWALFESVESGLTDQVTPKKIMDAMWTLVGTLSGFVTASGDFDCGTLQQSRLEDVVGDLKNTFWSYTDDVDKCKLLVDAVMKYLSDFTWAPILTPADVLELATGYSSGQELCRTFVDLFPTATVGCDSVFCPEIYDPQCGSDGTTYDNPCKLEVASCHDSSIELAHDGECKSENCDTEVCTSIYDPQCGSDGTTYDNLCELNLAKCTDLSLELIHAGQCQPGNCDSEACTKNLDPQCGSDGTTYDNLCELNVAKCADSTLELHHSGECKSEPDCATFVDCNGECGGSATEDCSGTCNGDAIADCNGECGGSATEDCYGTCNGDAIPDCNGDCEGTADYDECGECVGGNTGIRVNRNAHRIDCLGTCDGDWFEDDCGICGPPFDRAIHPYGSTVKDCSGDCRPGADLAWVNECGECVGGTTGKDANAGTNECGECASTAEDTSNCEGCDGVPNSGKFNDACGVCDGDGTRCVAVSSVDPGIAPSGQILQLSIGGAGLDRAELQCSFRRQQDQSLTTFAASPDGPQQVTCDNVQLDPGVYEVAILESGTVLGTVDMPLVIYNSDITLTMTPLEVNLEDALLQGLQLSFEADGNVAFSSIAALIEQYSERGLSETLVIRDSNNDIHGHLSAADANTLTFDFDPLPKKSCELKLFPTISGLDLATPSGMGFVLTFYAVAPALESAILDDSGSSVVVTFDIGVSRKGLRRCDDIFQRTSKFGESPHCRWIDQRRLQINIGLDEGNGLIQIGDTLTLKENALSAYDEAFSRKASDNTPVLAPLNPILPVAHIDGNKVISRCGTLALSARASTGGGGRDMTYQWSVCGGPQGYQSVSFSSPDPRDILIEGTELQTDQDYEICLEVSNFLTSGPVRRVTVRRSSTDGPEVVIVPNDVDVNNALVSKSFTLVADVKFSTCFQPKGINYEWFVDDDSVPLNLKTRTSSKLLVKKHTLPGDQSLVFTVRVSQATDADNFVERSITITTAGNSRLQPKIDKPSEFTIGRLGEDVVLEASRSIDPDKIPLQMRYKWLCLQVTQNTACFIKGGNGETFPSVEDAYRDVLVLDPQMMLPDTSYRITLEVAKGNRRESTSVVIHVVDGKPPQVILTSPTGIKYDTHENIQLDAVIISEDTDVDVIRWQAIQKKGFGFADINDINNSPAPVSTGYYTSTLLIEKGTLTPGFKYVFRVSACIADKCGETVVEVETIPVVTSCVLSIAGGNSYSVLDMVTFNVDNCITSLSAYPLSYQMFRLLDEAGKYQTITSKQNFPVSEVIGMEAREGTSENKFFAKVCNAFGSCSWFGATATVTALEGDDGKTLEDLIDNYVNKLELLKNYLGAVVNFNIITNAAGSASTAQRRRRRAVSDSTETATKQLELMEKVLDSTILDYSDAQLLIDQLTSVNIEDLSLADRSRLLLVIKDIELAFDSEHPIESSSAETILDITWIIAQDKIPEQLNLILSDIKPRLTSSLVADLTLGADALEIASDNLTISIQRVIPSGVFRTKSTSGGAYVDFGAQIAERYGPIWTCSGGDTCSGVVVHYEHYSTETEYLITTSLDVNRAADIITISLHDPSSDAELDIQDLTSPIAINMTITRPQSGISYECRYLSESEADWLSNGVSTVIQTSTVVTCLANHLTTFTVIAVEPIEDDYLTTTDSPGRPKGEHGGLGPAITALIVVVILLIIIIIILVVVIYIKKSQKRKVMPLLNEPEINETKTPSPPRSQPSTPEDQLHGNIFESRNETQLATSSEEDNVTRDSPRLQPDGQSGKIRLPPLTTSGLSEEQTCPPTSSSGSSAEKQNPIHDMRDRFKRTPTGSTVSSAEQTDPEYNMADRFKRTPTSSSMSSGEHTDPEHDMGDSPPLYPPLKLSLPTRQSTLSSDSSMTIPDLPESPYEPNQTPIFEDHQDSPNSTHIWTPSSLSSIEQSRRDRRSRSESFTSSVDTDAPLPSERGRPSNRPKTARKVRSGLPNIST